MELLEVIITSLENIHIPRVITYTPNLNKSVKKELLTFCDASVKAIAAVSYMRTTYEDGSTSRICIRKVETGTYIGSHNSTI